MQLLKNLTLHFDQEIFSLTSLTHRWSKELFPTCHPIAFPATLTPHTIGLILFLYEQRKSFFPFNPDVPLVAREALARETRSHLFDPESKSYLYQSTLPSLIDSPSLLLQTSGSSSAPKVAVLSYDNLYYSALGTVEFFKLTDEHCWHLALPLFHVGGLLPLFRMLLVKGSVSLSPLKPFLPHPKATHTSFVPTQLYRLLQQEIPLGPSLEVLLVGGAATTPNLIQECKQRGLPLYLTYGMTESASQVTCGLYSSGTVLPYRDLSCDASGEIGIKGATLFQGYLSKEGNIELPLNPEGFFMTNDLGHYDGEKGLTIFGRRDRQFISGGENIQPEEIERVFKDLFSLSYCKIVPEPSSEYGMVSIAYVDPFPSLSYEEIKARLKTALPSYKIPKKVKKAEQFPSLKERI